MTLSLFKQATMLMRISYSQI